jgi:transposase-like protein
MDKPHACPFCLCLDVRLLVGAQDGMPPFKCHDCGRTFHTPDLRTSAAAYAFLDQQHSAEKPMVH